MMTFASNSPLSLLWIDADQLPVPFDLPANFMSDMNIKALLRQLSLNPTYEKTVRQILLHLNTDADVIRYRQAIISDLLNAPDSLAQLETVLEAIVDLEKYLTAPQWRDNQLRQVAWRLSELERYVECVGMLHDALQGANFTSRALQNLTTQIANLTQSDLFQDLQRELPTLTQQIRTVRSVTIGINLDDDLRPVSATLLSVHEAHFADASMMTRLFGGFFQQDGDASKTKLHNARHIEGIQPYQIELENRNSPFMPPLFRDLSELMDATSRPIVQALRKFTQVNTRLLIGLKDELAFYLGAVRWVQDLLAKGVPLCQPEVAPADERITALHNLYNINLAHQLAKRHDDLSESIVLNDALLSDAGRIFILTGPNQGGKTTYTQAIGLAQMLFQAGLHVPASEARMSPVDGIYTHFATEERPDSEAGRLGEESRRLHGIFERATRHSLILLNESLASTNATESLYIARDVVRVLRMMGVRAIFATHLHDLAQDCADLNTQTQGDSIIISMVSQVNITTNDEGEVIKRTYRIIPAEPMSKSYAIELAARYGISFDQLTSLLKGRGVLKNETYIKD
jgi:DNA mismatch repair protein MutS